MRKRLLLMMSLVIVIGIIIVPSTSQASDTGFQADLTGDVINYAVDQNQTQYQTLRNGAAGHNRLDCAAPDPVPSCDLPPFDITQFDLNANGSSLIFTQDMNGIIPTPYATGAALTDWPAGTNGGSWVVLFNSSTMTSEQITGKSCGSYDASVPIQEMSLGGVSKQDSAYAQCTDAKDGPFPAPNFKLFFQYSEAYGNDPACPGGTACNVPDVEWGIFDQYSQSLTFHDLSVEEACSGGKLGGGTLQDTTAPCPWSASVTHPVAGKTRITVTLPYRPTYRLDDDNDGNALADDEARSYPLAVSGGTISGIIGTSWVDQFVNLPAGAECTPTDSACTTKAHPQQCVNTSPLTSPTVDTTCAQKEATNGGSDLQKYVANPHDCTPDRSENGPGGTPGKKQASCTQGIGGFVYVVDWAGKAGPNSNNSYTIGQFGFPVPGYIPVPTNATTPGFCSNQIEGLGLPRGEGIYTNSTRQSGYGAVVLPYGVNLTDGDYGSGAKPGWWNLPRGGVLPPTSVGNPISPTQQSDPLVNDSNCSYTPFLGSHFVDGNGVGTTTT
ncbi:MAG: hypothetical protein ABR548_08200 [Actinomycetota bacterium]